VMCSMNSDCTTAGECCVALLMVCFQDIMAPGWCLP
jgi:hypothetical protein